MKDLSQNWQGHGRARVSLPPHPAQGRTHLLIICGVTNILLEGDGHPGELWVVVTIWGGGWKAERRLGGNSQGREKQGRSQLRQLVAEAVQLPCQLLRGVRRE